MKYVEVKRCNDCPAVYGFYYFYGCDLDDNIIIENLYIIHKDCPLKDYPETVSEFLKNKI